VPTRCRRGTAEFSRGFRGGTWGYCEGTVGYRGDTTGGLGGTRVCRGCTRSSTEFSGACARACNACACARVLMCVFAFIRVRARCVGARMRASVSTYARARAFPSDCVFARACCVCSERVCAPSHRTAATCGIYSSARAARRWPRARGCVRCHRPGSRASAAGVTWRCRTAKAEWAARNGHTSLVDAAGAIYVIGGYSYSDGSTGFQDVWASTDGGARPNSVGGWVGELLWGTLGGTKGVTKGY
jgi:hypothetical protein